MFTTSCLYRKRRIPAISCTKPNQKKKSRCFGNFVQGLFDFEIVFVLRVCSFLNVKMKTLYWNIQRLWLTWLHLKFISSKPGPVIGRSRMSILVLSLSLSSLRVYVVIVVVVVVMRTLLLNTFFGQWQPIICRRLRLFLFVETFMCFPHEWVFHQFIIDWTSFACLFVFFSFFPKNFRVNDCHISEKVKWSEWKENQIKNVYCDKHASHAIDLSMESHR